MEAQGVTGEAHEVWEMEMERAGLREGVRWGSKWGELMTRVLLHV